MTIKPIKTQRDYRKALNEIEKNTQPRPQPSSTGRMSTRRLRPIAPDSIRVG
jgi:hypothetical protein